jgi:hypothetical protein
MKDGKVIANNAGTAKQVLRASEVSGIAALALRQLRGGGYPSITRVGGDTM